MPVRIYDISKKLGLENKEVLFKAKELGLAAARVASSSLDKITAEYLEQQLIQAHPNLVAPRPAPQMRRCPRTSRARAGPEHCRAQPHPRPLLPSTNLDATPQEKVTSMRSRQNHCQRRDGSMWPPASHKTAAAAPEPRYFTKRIDRSCRKRTIGMVRVIRSHGLLPRAN